jgi:cytochrome c peroxidase
MLRRLKWLGIIAIINLILMQIGCRRDNTLLEVNKPTIYQFNTPKSLPNTTPRPIPANNITTVEGVKLGRMLFYDPILSANNTQSCASCHHQNRGFTDLDNVFSTGIDGSVGKRNAMPLMNLLWAPTLFWDGRDVSLEVQALHPIVDATEMKSNMVDVMAKLNSHPTYPDLFKKAFGITTIDSIHLGKALAQFERTLISGNSKFDKVIVFKTDTFTPSEMRGYLLFSGNSAEKDGDCIHCHTSGSTFTDFEFKNNGLDITPNDSGRYLVTKNIDDIGKFKTPSLRNVAITSPYMHDGRFKTLEEVLDHYNTDFNVTPLTDPVMQVQVKARLSIPQRNDIIAFLKTLTDSSFLQNPAFGKP